MASLDALRVPRLEFLVPGGRRSFVWKTIRKIDKVVGPRTRIHRISKHHHNDQDSAAAAGDAQPPISGLRTGQRIRKGRKTRMLKILNGLCGTT